MPLIVSDVRVSYGVAGGLGRLDVLQRPEHVEEAHRDDHREIRDEMSAAERRKEVAEDRNGQVERGGFRPRADRRDAGHPRDERADADGDDAARQVSLEAHAAEVGQHHDRERRQADDGMRERAEQEAERDEAQRDAGERREQRRARRGLADALGDKRRARAR